MIYRAVKQSSVWFAAFPQPKEVPACPHAGQPMELRVLGPHTRRCLSLPETPLAFGSCCGRALLWDWGAVVKSLATVITFRRIWIGKV